MDGSPSPSSLALPQPLSVQVLGLVRRLRRRASGRGPTKARRVEATPGVGRLPGFRPAGRDAPPPKYTDVAEQQLRVEWPDTVRLPAGRTSTSAAETGGMYTLGLDTIGGAKLLQLKFGAAGAFQPDQAVLHGGRRARFVRMSDGAAIIRHVGDDRPVAVALETLSVPSQEVDSAAPRASATRIPRQSWASPSRRWLGLRAGIGPLPRRPQRRPALRP